MNIWWLRIATANFLFSTYEELKYRKVVATGWQAIGDLRTLIPLADAAYHADDETAEEAQEARAADAAFRDAIQALRTVVYGGPDEANNPLPALLNLFKIKAGDIVIGVENARGDRPDGGGIRGFCQMPFDSVKSYWYDCFYNSEHGFEYAHTVGFPVKWIDWNGNTFGHISGLERIAFHFPLNGIARVGEGFRDNVLTVLKAQFPENIKAAPPYISPAGEWEPGNVNPRPLMRPFPPYIGPRC